MSATVTVPKRAPPRRVASRRRSADARHLTSKLDRNQTARVVRAEARIRSGFYDGPVVLAVTIDRLLADLR